METTNLIQGTPEWHAHRDNHFNASDAPAMMGESKYKTRTQLLDELKTGHKTDHDAATQRRFADGHRFEALARPLAEEIIGSALFPVTGTSGRYSASFDGITIDDEIVFEHKTLNDDIRACKTSDDLSLDYRIQMEQQLMISGASKCLFMATKWDANDELLEQWKAWYSPDLALRKQIIAGWDQFAKDLEAHEVVVHAEKPKSAPIMALPALAVQIRGEVVVSNLPAFKDAAAAYIEQINVNLKTDDDFAEAEANIKFCGDGEKNLELSKAAALAQTQSIDELMRAIDYIKDQFRSKRLILEKLVKEQKETIKRMAIDDASEKYHAHIRLLEAEIAPVRLTNNFLMPPNFIEAAKNKRTLASLHDAISTELSRGVQYADEVARQVRGKLAWCKDNAAGFGFLFPDLKDLVFQHDEPFQAMIMARINDHKQAEDEKEAKAKAEDDAKAAENASQGTITPPADTTTPAIENIAPQAKESATAAPIAPAADPVRANEQIITGFIEMQKGLGRLSDKKAAEIRAYLIEFVIYQAGHI